MYEQCRCTVELYKICCANTRPSVSMVLENARSTNGCTFELYKICCANTRPSVSMVLENARSTNGCTFELYKICCANTRPSDWSHWHSRMQGVVMASEGYTYFTSEIEMIDAFLIFLLRVEAVEVALVSLPLKQEKYKL